MDNRLVITGVRRRLPARSSRGGFLITAHRSASSEIAARVWWVLNATPGYRCCSGHRLATHRYDFKVLQGTSMSSDSRCSHAATPNRSSSTDRPPWSCIGHTSKAPSPMMN